MKDQIIGVDGQPVDDYNESLDNAVLPVMGGPAGRMYLGISKPELIAMHLFAQHFVPSQIDTPDVVSRLAHRCRAAANILLAAMRATP